MDSPTHTEDSHTRALAGRREALRLVEQAQSLLHKAAEASCPLRGWSEGWTDICAHAEGIKALWHRLDRAPLPTGLSGK